MHQRRIIRNAIAECLNGQTAAQDRVWAAREAPANIETLLEEGPVIMVYTRTDTLEERPASGMHGACRRKLELAVEVTASGKWVVDDTLDDLSDQIENLLEAFEIEGLPSAEIMLASSQIDSTDEFDQPVGGALLMFDVTYWRPYRPAIGPDADLYCPTTVSMSVNGAPPEVVSGCDGH